MLFAITSVGTLKEQVEVPGVHFTDTDVVGLFALREATTAVGSVAIANVGDDKLSILSAAQEHPSVTVNVYEFPGVIPASEHEGVFLSTSHDPL